MNERILEIAKEADPSGWYYGIDPRVMDPEIKKFAELIVKQCIRLCDQVDIVGADECIDNIKEHFGVK